MNTNNLNIKNLKELWTAVGKERGLYFENHSLEGVYISEESWPNRVWLKDEENHEHWQLAVEFLQANLGLTLSTFTDLGIAHHRVERTSKQYGMAKPIERTSQASKMKLVRVTDESDAKLWSSLFSIAFSYSISAKTVTATSNLIEYYVAVHEGTPIGTVALFASDTDGIGIHSMGVVPEHRGKGLAREIMLGLFDLSRNRPQNHFVLQASEAGKSLYEKLGFKTEFIQNNYRLKAINHD